MDTVMVNVNGRASLEIVMQPSISILNEILITGYKSEIRSEVSTSIASIKSKDINKLVIQSVEQALQGQAPGVSVTNLPAHREMILLYVSEELVHWEIIIHCM